MIKEIARLIELELTQRGYEIVVRHHCGERIAVSIEWESDCDYGVCTVVKSDEFALVGGYPAAKAEENTL